MAFIILVLVLSLGLSSWYSGKVYGIEASDGWDNLSSGGMEYIGGGKVCSLPGSTVMDVE